MKLEVKIMAEAGQARKVRAFVDGAEVAPFGLNITRALCATSGCEALEHGGTFNRESGAWVVVNFPDVADMLTAADFLDEIVRRADAVNAAFEAKYVSINDSAETYYVWPALRKTGRRR